MTNQSRSELLAGIMLTFAGGTMDACTYLGHGHVFATAQTGNIVLLAINLAGGNVDAALRHLPSLGAFCAAIVFSRMIEAVLDQTPGRSSSVRLLSECIALFALAWIADRLPDMVTTACVAFIGGLQLTTHSRVDRWSFNSTITTGNLRDLFSALTLVWLHPGEVEHRRHATALGLICAAFFLGALLGGCCMARIGDRALLVTAAAVLLAAMLLRGKSTSPNAFERR